MGAEFSAKPQEPPPSNLIQRLFKSKPDTASRTDDWILNYNKSNTNVMNDVSLLDQKRAIFVSLIGLFQTYTNVPSVILYSSLFLLPIKRKWIYNPSEYQYEMNKHCNSFLTNFTGFQQDINATKEFIELLKWKDSQNLLFCMLDDYHDKINFKSNNYNSQINNYNIASFWYYFNDKLQQLYDPIARNKYNPLKFDQNYYENNYLSAYNIPINDIYSELCFLSINMKYKSIKEILYQSNPDSFNIMISFDEYLFNNNNNEKNKMIHVTSIVSLFGTHSHQYHKDKDKGEWFISADYDPTDM